MVPAPIGRGPSGRAEKHVWGLNCSCLTELRAHKKKNTVKVTLSPLNYLNSVFPQVQSMKHKVWVGFISLYENTDTLISYKFTSLRPDFETVRIFLNWHKQDHVEPRQLSWNWKYLQCFILWNWAPQASLVSSLFPVAGLLCSHFRAEVYKGPQACFWIKTITSKNHRITGFGRDVWRSSPTLCYIRFPAVGHTGRHADGSWTSP